MGSVDHPPPTRNAPDLTPAGILHALASWPRDELGAVNLRASAEIDGADLPIGLRLDAMVARGERRAAALALVEIASIVADALDGARRDTPARRYLADARALLAHPATPAALDAMVDRGEAIEYSLRAEGDDSARLLLEAGIVACSAHWPTIDPEGDLGPAFQARHSVRMLRLCTRPADRRVALAAARAVVGLR